MFFAIQQTSAYESAANFIKTNQEIRNKVGIVKGIFLVPFGAISMTTNSQGSTGQADLHFIVKGSEKYLDLNLLMNKETEAEWQIEIKEE